MKGPGLRIDLDVRRIWRCPRCDRLARTSGAVASQRCTCAGEGVWMQLQPPVKREPFRPAPRDAEPPDADSESGDSMTVEVEREIYVEIEQIVDAPHVEPLQPEANASTPILAPQEAPDAPPATSDPSPPKVFDDGFGAGIAHDAADEAS